MGRLRLRFGGNDLDLLGAFALQGCCRLQGLGLDEVRVWRWLAEDVHRRLESADGACHVVVAGGELSLRASSSKISLRRQWRLAGEVK
jgi:hypothetical protein